MAFASLRTTTALCLLALSGLASCDEQTPVACTSIFAASTVTLLDHTGAPVTDAVVTSILARTGDTLFPISSAGTPGGTYILIDDGSRGQLRHQGDDIVVHASRDSLARISALYEFDVPGGCHVHKVSGPDTLSLP